MRFPSPEHAKGLEAPYNFITTVVHRFSLSLISFLHTSGVSPFVAILIRSALALVVRFKSSSDQRTIINVSVRHGAPESIYRPDHRPARHNNSSGGSANPSNGHNQARPSFAAIANVRRFPYCWPDAPYR